MRVMAQMGMVMNLDKCIGCHTCSVTCKQAWTNRAGTEYVWFNNVETRPGQGYPRRYEDQETWQGGWTLNRRGRLQLKAGGRLKKLLGIFASPVQPELVGLLRAVDLRLRDPGRRPARRRLPGRPAEVADHRRGHQDHLVGELGRQPRRRHRAGPPRPDRREGPPRVRGQDPVRVRADLHVLPAADLRALPQPVVHGVLPVRRDLQARRGRHRAGRPGPLPRLAAVHHRLPVQEDLLQPQVRQGREVHVLLPAGRGRPARPSARRPASAGCATSGCSCTTPTAVTAAASVAGRAGPLRGPARPDARPERPGGDRGGPASRASRRTGWTPPGARRSTRWPRSTGWRCRCIRSTGRCRWSGTSRRCRRSSTCCASRATTPRTAARCSARSTRCGSRSSTSPSCSPPATPTIVDGVLRKLAAMRAYMRGHHPRPRAGRRRSPRRSG